MTDTCFRVKDMYTRFSKTIRNSTTGFTFVEVLMVLVVIVAVSTVLAISLSRYTRGQALLGAVNTSTAILNDARSRTLSSQGGVAYGVHFETDRIVLFRGNTYNSSDSTNEVTFLDTRVQIGTISLAGSATSVVFERLTGKTSQTGTITFSIQSDTSQQKTLTIQKTGLVSYN